MKPLKFTVATADGPMDVHLAMPARAKRHRARAIVVLQEAFGVNPHILKVCDRLAAAGYLAAAPELFHRTGSGVQYGYQDFEKIRPLLPGITNDRLLMDVSAAYKFLVGRSDVDPRQITTIGFCMGGFASALAACHLPLAAAVSFYGGGLARARLGMGLTPLLDDFSGLSCPTLFFFGEQDQNITPEDVAAVRTRLQTLGKPHEIVVYPDAGHGFFCEERAAYHAASAAAAWSKTLQWLESQLSRTA
jgi:carboxymethylenebutenolidase